MADYWDKEIQNLKDHIEALEHAMREWCYTICDWAGADFVDQITDEAAKNLILDALIRAEQKEIENGKEG